MWYLALVTEARHQPAGARNITGQWPDGIRQPMITSSYCGPDRVAFHDGLQYVRAQVGPVHMGQAAGACR